MKGKELHGPSTRTGVTPGNKSNPPSLRFSGAGVGQSVFRPGSPAWAPSLFLFFALTLLLALGTLPGSRSVSLATPGQPASVEYAAFAGGGGTDYVMATAVGSDGSIYLAGYTDSADLPTASAGAWGNRKAGYDGFVARTSPDGATLIYMAYVGGSGNDFIYGLAIDADGTAFVTGSTASADLPVTAGAFLATYRGGSKDAFAAAISPGGVTLEFLTYLGGSGSDEGRAVAVSSTGTPYFVGYTDSANYPVTAGVYQNTRLGLQAAFVTAMNPSGTAPVASTYLGRYYEYGTCADFDPSGRIWVGGLSAGSNFPTSADAVQKTFVGTGTNPDGFAAALSQDLTALSRATYIGGSGDDRVWGIAAETDRIVLCGQTVSTDFPVTPGAARPSYGGGTRDAFVAVLSADITAFSWVTYLGGNGDDAAYASCSLTGGDIVVVHEGDSTNQTVTEAAFDTVYSGSSDPLVTRFSPTGALVYSTYFGGSGIDGGRGISPLADERVAIAGFTGTTGLANLDPPEMVTFDSTYGGGVLDGYSAILTVHEPPMAATPEVSPVGGSFTLPVQVAITCSTSGVSIRYTLDGTDPTTGSALYSSPFTIGEHTAPAVKARAFKTGYRKSPVASAAFAVTGRVAQPTAAPAGGTYADSISISLSTATSGASVRYTLDGSDPTALSSLYSAPLVIARFSTADVRAKAFRDGWEPSFTTAASYVVNGPVAAVALDPAPGTYTAATQVTLACSTEGAIIRYTLDGSDPTALSAVYSTPLDAPLDSVLDLKAAGFKSDWTTGPVASGSYLITGTVAAVSFDPPQGEFASPVSVSMSCLTSGSAVWYTLDGSFPSPGAGTSTLYAAPVVVPLFTVSNFRARGFRDQWTPGPTGQGTWKVNGPVETPVISPAGGNFTSQPTVTLTCATPGATVRYTLDGTAPGPGSTLYSGPFQLSLHSTLTLRAGAFRTYWSDSPEAAADFAVTGPVAAASADPAPGSYLSKPGGSSGPGSPAGSPAIDVTLTCATPGATIRYTLDNAEPGPGSLSAASGSTIEVVLPSFLRVATFLDGWATTQWSGGWYLETGTVSAPVAAPAPGSFTAPVSVALSTPTDIAAIRFEYASWPLGATPETPPDPGPASALYTGPIEVAGRTVVAVAARGYRDNFTPSPVSRFTFTVTGKLATPSISPAAGSYPDTVSMTLSGEAGSDLWYTLDGTDPAPGVQGSLRYDGPVPLERYTLHSARARSFRDGFVKSDAVAAEYDVHGPVAAPAADPSGGNFTAPVELSIACDTPGATVRYEIMTAEASSPDSPAPQTPPDPGASSPVYGGPIAIPGYTAAIVKTSATLDGWTPSPVSSSAITVTGPAPAPSFTPEAGLFREPVIIAAAQAPVVIAAGQDPLAQEPAGPEYVSGLSSGQPLPDPRIHPDDLVRFTLDGTDPGPASPILTVFDSSGAIVSPAPGTVLPPGSGTVPVGIDSIVEIRAATFRVGWLPSPVASGTWRVTGTVSPVEVSPPPGIHTSPLSATLSCATPGAVIRYTLDGTNPGPSSAVYTDPLPIGGDSTVEVRAAGFLTDWNDGPSGAWTWRVTGTVGSVSVKPEGGLYDQPVAVMATPPRPGDVIRFTKVVYPFAGVPGSLPADPDENSPLWEGSDTVPLKSSAAFAFRAFRPEWIPGPVTRVSYEVDGELRPPSFVPPPGPYPFPLSVKPSGVPPEVTVRFVLGGGEPGTESPAAGAQGVLIGADIGDSSSQALSFRSYRDGYIESAAANGSYVIGTTNFTGRSGIFAGGDGSEAMSAGAAALNTSGTYLVLLAGQTYSAELPLSAPGSAAGGSLGRQAFCALFEHDGTGSRLVGTRSFGGVGADSASSVAVLPEVPAGAARSFVLAGTFGTVSGVTHEQVGPTGASDAFVAIVEGSGMSSSTPTAIGGTGDDAASAVVALPDGGVIVCGTTWSPDFPVVGNRYLGGRPSASSPAWFALRLGPGLSGPPVWAFTFKGPAGSLLYAAVLSGDRLVLAGDSLQGTLPADVTEMGNAGFPAGFDAVAMVADPSDGALLGGVRFAGRYHDGFRAAAPCRDQLQRNLVVLGGETSSPDLPVTPGAWLESLQGGRDGFLVTLDPSTMGVEAATYAGGPGTDSIRSVSVSLDGRVLLAGSTNDTAWAAPGFDIEGGPAYGGGPVSGSGFAVSTNLWGHGPLALDFEAPAAAGAGVTTSCGLALWDPAGLLLAGDTRASAAWWPAADGTPVIGAVPPGGPGDLFMIFRSSGAPSLPRLSAPSLDPVAGAYMGPLVVTVSHGDPGACAVFRVLASDGSVPADGAWSGGGDTEWTGELPPGISTERANISGAPWLEAARPLILNPGQNLVVEAFAFRQGFEPSEAMASRYSVTATAPPVPYGMTAGLGLSLLSRGSPDRFSSAVSAAAAQAGRPYGSIPADPAPGGIPVILAGKALDFVLWAIDPDSGFTVVAGLSAHEAAGPNGPAEFVGLATAQGDGASGFLTVSGDLSALQLGSDFFVAGSYSSVHLWPWASLRDGTGSGPAVAWVRASRPVRLIRPPGSAGLPAVSDMPAFADPGFPTIYSEASAPVEISNPTPGLSALFLSYRAAESQGPWLSMPGHTGSGQALWTGSRSALLLDRGGKVTFIWDTSVLSPGAYDLRLESADPNRGYWITAAPYGVEIIGFQSNRSAIAWKSPDPAGTGVSPGVALGGSPVPGEEAELSFLIINPDSETLGWSLILSPGYGESEEGVRQVAESAFVKGLSGVVSTSLRDALPGLRPGVWFPAARLVRPKGAGEWVFSTRPVIARGETAPVPIALAPPRLSAPAAGHDLTLRVWCDPEWILSATAHTPEGEERFLAVPAGQALRTVVFDSMQMASGMGISLTARHSSGKTTGTIWNHGAPVPLPFSSATGIAPQDFWIAGTYSRPGFSVQATPIPGVTQEPPWTGMIPSAVAAWPVRRQSGGPSSLAEGDGQAVNSTSSTDGPLPANVAGGPAAAEVGPSGEWFMNLGDCTGSDGWAFPWASGDGIRVSYLFPDPSDPGKPIWIPAGDLYLPLSEPPPSDNRDHTVPADALPVALPVPAGPVRVTPGGGLVTVTRVERGFSLLSQPWGGASGTAVSGLETYPSSAEILASADGVTAIYSFSPVTGYKGIFRLPAISGSNDPVSLDYTGQNFRVSPGSALFVRASAGATLELPAAYSGEEPMIWLDRGFNLVSFDHGPWFPASSTVHSSAAAFIRGEPHVAAIYDYDPGAGGYRAVFRIESPDGTSGSAGNGEPDVYIAGSDFPIKAGKGYFMKALRPAVIKRDLLRPTGK